MNEFAAKPGTTATARRAEIESAPFTRVRDLVVNVYKLPNGQPVMGYVESLGADHAVVKDKLIEFELANNLIVNDGGGAAPVQPSAPPPQAAPAPTAPGVLFSATPAQVAPPKTPVPMPEAAPANGAAPATRISRRAQAQKGGMAPPPSTPPVQLSIPGSSPEQTAPPRTPVPMGPVNGFTMPTAPAQVKEASFTAPVTPVFTPPPPGFTPPAAAAGPVSQSVDLGPLLQKLDSFGVGLEAAVKNSDSAMKTAINLDAKTDHMMTVLWYICQNTAFGQTLAANKIDSLSKFKQYAQFLSNPQ